jgi:predicted nucleotidyltransferase
MAELDLVAADFGVSGRTLRRAAARGAIRLSRPSPHKVVLAATERRYIRTHWPLLDQLTRTLRTEKNVRLAVLFGSAARGDDRYGSDIDLLVELADYGRGGLPLARIGLKLESLLERPVQLVSVLDAETSAVLLSEAIADGRVLIDRDDRWSRLKRRERTLRRRAREDETRAQAEAWEALEKLAAG